MAAIYVADAYSWSKDSSKQIGETLLSSGYMLKVEFLLTPGLSIVLDSQCERVRGVKFLA